jgi:hypothetical protein
MTEGFGLEVPAVKRFRRGIAIALGVAVAAATLAASGSAVSEAHVLQFKGHGVKSLRVFRVSGPSTIFWTNTGSYFQLSTGGDYSYEGAVTSGEHEGTTFISRCLYSDVRVRAIGAWTITIRPGVAKLGTPIVLSGSGEQALPPFRLQRPMTMYWTNTGARFQTIPMTSRREGVVSSGLHHGRAHLRPGRYRFAVDAVDPEGPMGNWRIVIR